MKAQDLGTALKYFSEQSIGLSGMMLEQWYVDRTAQDATLAPARKRLENLLRNGGERNKYLFIGDRGAGKSTELNQLAKDLEDVFLVIRFSAVRATGRGHMLHHADLLLAVLLEVNQQCIKNGWLPTPAMDKAKGWLKDLTKWWEYHFAGIRLPRGETKGEASLSTILGEVQLNLQNTPLARDQMLEQVQARTNEFISKLNEITAKAEATNGGKPLLVIIEDIDKVSDQAATDVFLQHTQILLAPSVGIVYTFPKALTYLPDYAEIAKRFQNTVNFPNFIVSYPKKSRKKIPPSGFESIKHLVLQRIQPNLITAEALDALVLSSSGVPYWIVKMMKDATANAIAFNKKQVELPDVLSAQAIVRNDFLRQLEPNDLEFLLDRHADNSLTTADKQRMLRLMYIGALIEYENGGHWCDVHQTLLPLLPKRRKAKP